MFSIRLQMVKFNSTEWLRNGKHQRLVFMALDIVSNEH